MIGSMGKVDLQDFGKIASEKEPLPETWPDWTQLMKMLDLLGEGDDPAYWQLCARWALLRKYGLLLDVPGMYVGQEDGTNKLIFESDDIEKIQATWIESRKSLMEGDLGELFQTSFSNGRPLEWAIMDCGAATQFKLHAHPNLELIYCLEGELHEVRMDGDPIPVSQDAEGPSLTNSQRSWSFRTLRQGCWLTNEVGSVHKSFTATSGKGCKLLVLWGGSHADIPSENEPQNVNVGDMVNRMDTKVCECRQGAIVEETFLPDSEKTIRGALN